MTQIAEDLRAEEPAESLDPGLRARILSRAPDAAPDAAPKPAPARPRRLAWGGAAAALVAWLILFPMVLSHRQAANRPAASLPGAFMSRAGQHQRAPGSSPGDPSAEERIVAQHPAVTSLNASSDYASPEAITSSMAKMRTASHMNGHDYGGMPRVPARPMARVMASADIAPERQVHKEASITVEVADPEAKSDSVEQMVKAVGGYVAANTLSTGDNGGKTAELTVKVPVPQFESVMGQIAKLGNVKSKNINGEDITGKISDAGQAERVMEDEVQRSEARLRALGGRAKWNDQQDARDQRIQLAQDQARLLLLKKMATLATITVDLNEKPKAQAAAPPAQTGFLGDIHDATQGAMHSMAASVGALLALVVWAVAYSPVWVPLLIFGRYALRHYQRLNAPRDA